MQTEALTAEAIASMPRDKRVPAIYGRLVSLVYAGPRRDDQSSQWSYLASLSTELQILWATHDLDAEVVNGGFDQYFYNSSRFYVEEARQGLRLLNAVDHLALLERAVTVVRQRIPDLPFRDSEWRSVFVPVSREELVETALDQLDREWYAMPSTWYEALQDAVEGDVSAFVTE